MVLGPLRRAVRHYLRFDLHSILGYDGRELVVALVVKDAEHSLHERPGVSGPELVSGSAMSMPGFARIVMSCARVSHPFLTGVRFCWCRNRAPARAR